MEVIRTAIDGVVIIEPHIFRDSRGYFFESYMQREFDEKVRQVNFIQDNESKSSYGVLRGLHYQIQQPQGKLVRVVQGEVFDVAVDVRRSSATFGKWIGVILNAENKRQLWVPEGFAHGFFVLSDSAEILYKATDYYAPAHERCIIWNDRDLAIDWPTDEQPLLSDKDGRGSSLIAAEVFR